MDKPAEKPILPDKGIWTVEGLAKYLGQPNFKVMQVLSDNGVKVVSFSTLYKHKLFRLEDLRAS